MNKTILATIISLAIAVPALAQSPKASEQSKSKPAKQTPSNVDGKFTVLSSHIKSVGTIGKTSRYELISARVRGLDSPNISALLAYDSETDTLAVLASGVEPGLGVAIVNGGAQVGGNFLFGSKLRPDRHNENISNNSESEGSSAKSTSEGGSALSVSEGGDSTAVSVSDADAVSKSSSSSSSSSVAVQSQEQSSNNSNTNSRKNGNGPKPKELKK